MTRDKAKIIIGNIPINEKTVDHCYSVCEYQEAKTMAIKALEQEPCEDCISKEEVCDYIAEFVNHEYATDREHEMVEHIIGGIQHFSSVQPKTDVLDKIRADVINIADGRRSMSVRSVMKIIDKYTAESEE